MISFLKTSLREVILVID